MVCQPILDYDPEMKVMDDKPLNFFFSNETLLTIIESQKRLSRQASALPDRHFLCKNRKGPN